MNRLLLPIALFISFSCSAQQKVDESLPCWITQNYSEIITTQEAILKSYLYPINLDKAEFDAKIRIENGDFRLIGIGGFSITYPEIDLKKDSDILCKLGGRYLQGTSDAIEGKSHLKLINSFRRYAEKYNAIIVEEYRSNLNKEIE